MANPALPQAAQATAPAAETQREDTGTFASLKLRNFRLLLLGSTLSNLAQWIQQVTMSWLVYDITGSGAMLGLINLSRSVATVGLAPVAGVIIDRTPRRTLMIRTAAWLMLMSAVLGLVLLTGHQAVWYLFAFAFMGGLAQAIDMPLRQTVVFSLVPRYLASNAVALIQTGWGLMRSLGPAVGGFLIVLFGPGGNFLVQSLAYALIILNTLRLTFPPNPPAAPGQRANLLRNMREGIAYIRHQPETRAFLMMGWVLPLFIIPTYTALPPIYAKEVFDGGPRTLGLLLSAVGVGGVFGGLLAASLGRVNRRGLVQLTALFALAVSLVAFALSRNFILSWVLFAFSGFFEMIYLTSNQTLLQLSIPDDMRGRVTSLVTLNMGLSPLGAVYAGAGADLAGPTMVTVILSTLAGLIAVGAFLFSPTIREYRMDRAIARHTPAHGA